MEPLRVAIAQAAPCALDLPGTLEIIAGWARRAEDAGAGLVAFSETFIPCYPVWVDGGLFSQWDHGPAKELHAAYLAQSLEIGSPEEQRLAAIAADTGVAVAIGVSERAGRSMFNSLLVYDGRGQRVVHRRKLVPTHGERLVWRPGDAADLAPGLAAGAKVGGLICWEHWMPLPRQVLHDRSEEIHVAAWPHVREMYLVASRHFAFEGRCFVLAAGQILRRRDFSPESWALAAPLLGGDGDLIIGGGSAIIGPDGSLLAGPVSNEEALLVADLDPAWLARESLTLDTAGHYARPDLFRVEVDFARKAEHVT